MYYQSYFNTAVSLIGAYDGSTPLVHFLRQYFSQHKKHGSKDRKLITHLCYTYFRLGHALKELLIEERLKIALFLCNKTAGEWQVLYGKDWQDAWDQMVFPRVDFISKNYPSFSVAAIFPWKDQISDGVDADAFMLSHFTQPDLFLRIRPGHTKKVIDQLNQRQLSFHMMNENCIALPNSSKIDKLLSFDKEVVVQDYSSQQIAAFLTLATHHSSITLWDCCVASGGKSLLAVDTLGEIQLVVSDVRSSILHNLKQRFTRAGISRYQSIIADLSGKTFTMPYSAFEVVLCDAPCSGSGTWGRTPEQLYFFTADKLQHYAGLQRKIITNVIPYVAKGGYLLYITCSVFRKENEEQVAFIQQSGEFELVKMGLLKGYDIKADSMFAALLRRG